ncbi:MAG: universal stress protein [Bacteroidales bacterium]|jgi:nucleotide-binding universal stress UspA family protein|nr:universal stress protein [Bacteroidales bacterium]
MLSEIIVGIDFSSTSEKALHLAVDVANRTGANILMVWVEVAGETTEEVTARFDNLVAACAPLLHGKQISYLTVQGKVSTALSEVVSKRNASLLVIGTHGKSGFDETFAGANAYKTIAGCSVPVLAVRENFEFDKALEKIILPIDSTADTRQKVPWTIEFAKMFPKAEIFVLGLFSFKSKDLKKIVKGYVESVEKLLKEKNMRCNVDYRDSENSTITTLDYAKEIDADMIVIMKEQEKTFTNMLFLGPYALQMINLSHFPVLVVPSKQINSGSR